MRIKIKKNSIYYFLMAVLFFEPVIFLVMPRLSVIHGLIQILLLMWSLFIILYTIIKRKHVKYSAIILLLCFFMWLIISNLFHLKTGRDFLKEMIPVIAIIVIIIDATQKNELIVLLKEFSIYGSIVVLSNLVSQLLCGENGIYHDWLQSWQAYYVCGNANSFIFHYLLVLGVLFAYIQLSGSFVIWSYIVHVIMIFSMFYALQYGGSTTGFVVMIALLLLRIISIRVVREFIFKYYKIALIGGFIFATWIVIGNGWKSEWLLDILQRYLNENSSFLARGIIWNNAMQLITEAPFLGHGTSAVRIVKDIDGILRSAHNNYLEITIMGGVPALIFYLLYIIKSLKGNRKQSYLLIVVVIMYLIVYMVEQNPFYIGFYVMTTLCNVMKNNIGEDNVKS
ncbi:O-antigen ligase family protein [Enterococcus columbae]|uniref:O-antigen ligase-related domain-containing protein n=1 Tax=Enterococcus columbae DSM 7374 = ATCC 51263 TaxID=1121865 RepID=S0KHP6_9ENTE|nr:O-antigen ligase family protein [Enterococcus columbae]EOT40455.1 hypothetical protein OMW_01317 [Enterococcus columbae DSM 7374 = ATCC 51263]EOW80231.1 hypothetical protein I568_01931 [Enterococcus columbae DSM 7374 = ATCC 51263]OJG25609.1 hypothetical protein RR47_GL001658 [Enterococcus columbae DSM 7374 = ATCC 51263]